MIIRSSVLSILAAFSLNLFAAPTQPVGSTSQQIEKGAEIMKQMFACDEVKGAKHVMLTVVIGISTVFRTDVEQQMQPYLAAIERARNCADYDAAYAMLAEVFEKITEQSAEKYFESADGKKGVEDLIEELRKLKTKP